MLTLVNYPVTTNSGIIKNVFSGFSDCIIEFKREDISVKSVNSGLNNKISVTIENTDLTSELNINEFVYIYATTLNYVYDGVYKVLDIVYSSNDTVILLDTEFIEIATDNGYLNYKQNYFVEYKLVDVSNNNIMLYPETLSDDGLSSGIVKLNVSNIVDYLKSDILTLSGCLTDASDRFKVMYREVYRENDTDIFILLDETSIIIIYSADSILTENVSNKFNEPVIFESYPFFLSFIHSKDNYVSSNIDVKFNELDINKENITTNNYITTFESSNFGLFQVNFNDKTKAIDVNTEYIEFMFTEMTLPDYDPNDYDSNDYKTT